MNKTVEDILTLFIKMNALKAYWEGHPIKKEEAENPTNETVYKTLVQKRLVKTMDALEALLKAHPDVLKNHPEDVDQILTEENQKRIINEAFTFKSFSIYKTVEENIIDTLLLGEV